MQTLDPPRSLIAFSARFPDDRACAAFLAELRWPTGFRCPWGGTRAWHHTSRPRIFQCSACRRQHSVTAGTVMHRAKIPLVEWFWAAWLFGQDKRGVSALQLSRLLERRYETDWRLLHKIRDALAEDPDAFPLTGVIEVDETYTGGKVSKGRGGRSLSDPRRALVVLAVERQAVEAGNPGIRGTGLRCGRAQIAVVEDASTESLLGFVKRVCAKGTTVRTDGWSAYFQAAPAGFDHVRRVEGRPENASELFPLVHTLFANMKTWINGTYGLPAGSVSAARRVAGVLGSQAVATALYAHDEIATAVQLARTANLRLLPVYLDGRKKDAPYGLATTDGLNAADVARPAAIAS